ncbi:MAG TPA: CvpA family protein [Kiritimatiellia bacterium]|nr:CvpA family protein [Kiritimatiellia bacterium]
MNAFDYLALAFIVSAILRGFKQGLSKEFYRLIRLGIALLAGTSLYASMSDAMGRVSGAASGITDPLTFVGITGGIWMILRTLRSWIEGVVAKSAPAKVQKSGGAAAAGIKAVILVGGVIAVFNLASWIPGHRLVAEDSLSSKLARPFLAEAGEE